MLILAKTSGSAHPFSLLRSTGINSATVTLDTTGAKLIFLAGHTSNATSTWSDNRGNTFAPEPVVGHLCAAYCLNPIGSGPGHAFTMLNNPSFPVAVASAWGYSGTPAVDQPFITSPVSASPVILPPLTTGAPETLILVGWAGTIFAHYPTFDSGFRIVWATGWGGGFDATGIAFLRRRSVGTVNLRIMHGGPATSVAKMMSFN